MTALEALDRADRALAEQPVGAHVQQALELLDGRAPVAALERALGLGGRGGDEQQRDQRAASDQDGAEPVGHLDGAYEVS